MGPNQKLSKILTVIKSSDFIYPIVFLIFFTTVIALFTYSTNFLIENIDKIFSPSQEEEGKILDMAKYAVVAKKLNLEVFTPEENPAIPAAITPTTETPTSDASTLDKTSITINILDTTSKKGVAATLAKALENAGFAKAVTGNEKKSYALTTIIINDEKKDYLPLLEEAVKLSYPKVVTETVTGKTDFDVTIMIGAQ